MKKSEKIIAMRMKYITNLSTGYQRRGTDPQIAGVDAGVQRKRVRRKEVWEGRNRLKGGNLHNTNAVKSNREWATKQVNNRVKKYALFMQFQWTNYSPVKLW